MRAEVEQRVGEGRYWEPTYRDDDDDRASSVEGPDYACIICLSCMAHVHPRSNKLQYTSESYPASCAVEPEPETEEEAQRKNIVTAKPVSAPVQSATTAASHQQAPTPNNPSHPPQSFPSFASSPSFPPADTPAALEPQTPRIAAATSLAPFRRPTAVRHAMA